MTTAEDRRIARIAALSDKALLFVVLAHGDALTDAQRVAFIEMRARGFELSTSQRSWVEGIARQVIPFDEADGVPKGKPVETPAVLRNLPKAPPGRRP
jgi:hypothetical protein